MVPEADARLLFQQLIVAMDYCHRLGIVNRDVKVGHAVSAGCLMLLVYNSLLSHGCRYTTALCTLSFHVLLRTLPPSSCRYQMWAFLTAAAGQHSAARRCARHPEAVRLWVLKGRRDRVGLQNRVRHTRVHGARGKHWPIVVAECEHVCCRLMQHWGLLLHPRGPVVQVPPQQLTLVGQVMLPPQAARLRPNPIASRSLQVLKGEAYDGKAVDVWSCGCSLYILLCGDYP
jgi:serine/threonine protein kinase